MAYVTLLKNREFNCGSEKQALEQGFHFACTFLIERRNCDYDLKQDS